MSQQILWSFLAGLVSLAAGTTSPAVAGELVTLTGRTMGTTYTVKLSSPPGDVTTDALKAEIDGCLETVNDQMSTWRNDSELSRFNRFQERGWFPVSAETARVVGTALETSRSTDGAFDVTVGPLVNLWSFGPDASEKTLPSKSEIEKTKSQIGFEFLQVRQSPPALKKTRPEISVDLSAIAKGFGVDQLCEILNGRGIDSYMVEIGGELRTGGRKPDGDPWRVGIETPTPFSRGVQQKLELSGRALATSGDYRNFVVIDGKTYSHTIDPRTGKPVDHRLTSASVVAESCMQADAYATALMVLGPEAGYNWAKQRNIAALFLVRDGDGFYEKATPAFEELLPTQAETTMTTTWLIAAGVFLIAVLLMSVGVILSNRRIAGSCGGLAGFRDESGRTLCEACSDPAPDCLGTEDAENRVAEDAESEKADASTRETTPPV